MQSTTTNHHSEEATVLASKFDITTLQCRHEVFSPNYGLDLTVVQLGYGAVASEDVLSGKARPVEAYLAADGRGWMMAWHEGPETGEPIYVERHDRDGCQFHGYVDSISRRVIQT